LPALCFPAEFIRVQGRHSLDALIGIPSPLAALTNSQQGQFIVSGSHANQFAGGENESELLVLDSERSDLRLTWQRRLGRCFSVAVELPYIYHSGGYFDNAIQRWHGYFGLPNANRDDVADDQIIIAYTDTSGSDISIDRRTDAVGDIHLQFSRQASCAGWGSFRGAVDQRWGIKLPTGDKRQLSGNGAFDVYYDITTQDLLAADSFGFKTAFGLILPGDSDILRNGKSAALYGSAVLGWWFNPRLELLVQADWHTALYDSRVRELSAISAQLAFGGRWRTKAGNTLDIALQEDLAPDTAPDVGIVMVYRYRF